MSNPHGRNQDLHHAHNNGATIPELSQRTRIPEYTLRCMMDHETCVNCGEPDVEAQDAQDLWRVLGRDVHPVPGVHDGLGGCRG